MVFIFLILFNVEQAALNLSSMSKRLYQSVINKKNTIIRCLFGQITISIHSQKHHAGRSCKESVLTQSSGCDSKWLSTKQQGTASLSLHCRNSVLLHSPLKGFGDFIPTWLFLGISCNLCSLFFERLLQAVQKDLEQQKLPALNR